MMQGNLVPNHTHIPQHNHRYHNHNLNIKLIKLNQKRHLRGPKAQLILNKLEKSALIVGLVVAVGLMLALVSTKLTNDIYQHQVITVNANISKFHNLNNSSRQRISDLQSNGRLQKVARQNHLKFSSHDVRNVK